MKSFIIIITLLALCLNEAGTAQIVTRDAEVDKHTKSSSNLMTCHANATSNVVSDLEDCDKVATYMATNKSACAKYRSCTLMTRAGIGKAQAVQVTSPTELRYAFSAYFEKCCNVTDPIKPRLEKFPKTADGDLYLTIALCAVSDPKCNTGDQVSVCSDSTFEELKNAQANLTDVPKIGVNQDLSY
ncbi:uncharacterized protein MELLADRAFT_76897 [Melampsora larici-populina 98AG31]|uniref:Secreted protein n=1 Tax=Melampsora larici-populina (strain 98AG31 / pathotype 3-4-7) TaxID=747676 RepID=F4RA20_MELLP|nr:uncharacterized protein MELLADRAFT_76897 [Melampsora larici-populina 98AG31]EGG10631.1 secreted protein [Melampsora larici-populina 98AG31]